VNLPGATAERRAQIQREVKESLFGDLANFLLTVSCQFSLIFT
jgi:hypothetical protein